MAVLELPQSIIPNPSLRKRVEELSGQKVSACFQCEKCTNGCPVAFAMDVVPHKLMRFLQFGLEDEILHSYTIWLCASCQTCSARCPNGIDIAHIMDTLRQIAQHKGIKASQYNVPIFHSAFLSSLKRHGRVLETELAITYAWEGEPLIGILKLVRVGFAMFLRGKIKLHPSRVHAIGQVRNLFKKVGVKG